MIALGPQIIPDSIDRMQRQHLAIAVILTLATGCDNVAWEGLELRLQPPISPATVERNRSTVSNIILVDATGLEVTLQEPAQRIISLVPSATQTLRALGAIHTVVGRTDFDIENWVLDIPSVGGGLEPNFEDIIALEPDLVVRFAGDQDPQTKSRLDELEIPQIAVRPDRLTDLYASVRLLGKATGTEPAADSIVASIKNELADLQRWTSEKSKVHTAYILGGSPPWVAGPNSYIDEILALAGGRNVFSDLGFLYGSVSPEQLRVRKIDVVLISDRSQFDPRLTPGSRIEEIGNTLELPGPHIAETARHIARILHDDRVR